MVALSLNCMRIWAWVHVFETRYALIMYKFCWTHCADIILSLPKIRVSYALGSKVSMSPLAFHSRKKTFQVRCGIILLMILCWMPNELSLCVTAEPGSTGRIPSTQTHPLTRCWRFPIAITMRSILLSYMVRISPKATTTATILAHVNITSQTLICMRAHENTHARHAHTPHNPITICMRLNGCVLMSSTSIIGFIRARAHNFKTERHI